MKTYELGEIIAERQLTAHHADGKTYPVLLRIGKPAPDPATPGDWYCAHQISGVGDGEIRAIFGVDALQALTLTLQSVRELLAQDAAAEGVQLTWLGSDELALV
ncbi:DUF6968 family protein [Longispora albida]|uniref:DUF6968 family protein n=1 Tax=Longispora albida TaxID=203523 RepID=UPI00037F8229|nr:hypothetical protein [Longispora albida]